MTEERIKKIAKNMERMRQLRNNYKELKYSSLVGGAGITGMSTGSSPFDTSMNSIENIIDIEYEYKSILRETELLLKEAKKYIYQFNDRVLCAVLQLKYLKNLDIVQISRSVGISYEECERILLVHWNNLF